MVIVGSAFREGATVETHNNTKGLVRAFDVRTGKKLWQFNTIPRPGEFGNDTWENDSWADNGNVGVWTQITVDEELGLVYLPVETPSSDYYGGHRPGNNLFAESLVCVDLKTGQRKWHFQFVHHPDLELRHACRADPRRHQRRRPGDQGGRACRRKQGWLYVFDRVTGQPVWPIEERPVPQSDVPGEKTSPTQPHPTKPPAYARNYFNVPDDLIDFTPELRAQALEESRSGTRIAPSVFNPPILGDVNGLLGRDRRRLDRDELAGRRLRSRDAHRLCAGRRTTRRLAIAGRRAAGIFGYPVRLGGRRAAVRGSVRARRLLRRRFRAQDPRGAPADAAARGQRRSRRRAATPPPAAGGLNVQGLPIVKPPYGMLAAIDLDRGEIALQAPHGDTPDNVRNHPALKGLNIPKTGQAGTSAVGLVVTKTLVVMGDPQVTAPPGRPRGAMLRAYDKSDGQQVGAVWMPAIQSGSPMTYMVDGKQYIVVAVSGGNYSGEYIAFSLPN